MGCVGARSFGGVERRIDIKLRRASCGEVLESLSSPERGVCRNSEGREAGLPKGGHPDSVFKKGMAETVDLSHIVRKPRNGRDPVDVMGERIKIAGAPLVLIVI